MRESIQANPQESPAAALGGRPSRLWHRVSALVTRGPEREEAGLDALLAELSAVSRPNVITILSPKGGVGKTTCALVLGDLLASTGGLRCIAVDTNVDFGTLGTLAPSASRRPGSVADIFAWMDRIDSAADLLPFVSALPTGLHLLAAHPRTEVMAAITPDLHALLLDFLGRFYDVILLDVGTRVAGAGAAVALERADQCVLVSTPGNVAVSTVLEALPYLRGRPVTMVLNQVPRAPGTNARVEAEAAIRRQGLDRYVILPYDKRLRTMLNSSAYELSELEDGTRIPIKKFGVAVTELLV